MRDADRPTLIACSGGADSAALALALATTARRPVIAHVVHDLRPAHEALADRDATRELAEALGLEFAEASVRVSESGESNPEAAARELRYRALASLARERGIPFVATGHHADDQLETLLMRLVRGTGPRGLVGVHASRPLGGLTLIRPMLGVTRADTERLCAQAGVAWRHDATNDDESLLRAALRGRVLPVLEELAPDAVRRATHAAELQSELLGVLDDAIDGLHRHATSSVGRAPHASEYTLDRSALLESRPLVLAGLIQRLAGDLGRDRRGKASLDRITGAILDGDPESRVFKLGGAHVRVLEDRVEIRPGADRTEV